EMLFPVPLEREDQAGVTPAQAHLMAALADGVESLDPWTAEKVEEAFRDVLGREGATLKDVAQACRIAVTGRKVGPGLFEILSAVGPSITVDRLRAYAGGTRG
ncbi:MAG: hypothetical protein NTY63_04605, partial [Candidatus Bipolaricaulota bacterium]|nr:hypothetical protein [Candidatus Bipolaricaulota bacterium]